eukprot:jgi/Chlat1/209/Chrsp1S03123
MGCISSKSGKRATVEVNGKPTKLRRARSWRNPGPITKSQLVRMREEFWDTSPHYGGQKEIWDALHAAIDAKDLNLAVVILESAGVIVSEPDLSVCYDERGSKYELPNYILRDPANLLEDDSAAAAS